MKPRIKECTVIKDIGTYKIVDNKNYGEETLGRFYADGDGYCVFESLTFLFLYYFNFADYVNVELITKYGWCPDVSNYHQTGSIRGNLVDVLIRNLELFISKSMLTPDILASICTWFDQFKDGTPNELYYPDNDMALFVFDLLFCDRVTLCLHQYIFLNSDNKGGYLDATIYKVGDDDFKHHVPLSTTNIDLNSLTKVHIWNSHARYHHFEPILPCDNNKVAKCVDVLSKMQELGFIVDEREQNNESRTLRRSLRNNFISYNIKL
jgi:hypothetical protein